MAHQSITTAAVRFVAAATVCLASLAAAQGTDLPGYDATDLELSLPPSPSAPAESAPQSAAQPNAALTVEGEPIPSPAGLPAEYGPAMGEALEPIPAPCDTHHDLLPLTGDYPTLIESSGTWLNRGFWYADTEVVMMARTWNRHDVVMFQEFDAISNQTVLAQNVLNIPSIVPIQQQLLGESSPGYDGNIRLTLGRFLFRDLKNRDHAFEMLFFGGSELNESLAAVAQLTGTAEGLFVPGQDLFGNAIVRDQRGLHVPRSIDGTTPLNADELDGFLSFDRADAMTLDYSSRFLNWELNYNVAERLDKDRMELMPSGEWVRRAAPGITYDYAAGLRYFDLEEVLDWTATNIDSLVGETTDLGTVAAAPDGSYRLHTTNDLYGMQLGFGMTYQTDRWNVSLSTKQGFYINDARARRILTYTGDAAAAGNNFNLDLHENGLSYIGTGSVVARYHLRQNLSLRAGWEFMYITGLAFAPDQANFNPAVGQQLHLTGDAIYHGVNFGAEMFW